MKAAARSLPCGRHSDAPRKAFRFDIPLIFPLEYGKEEADMLTQHSPVSTRNFVALSECKSSPHGISARCQNAKGFHTQFWRIVKMQKPSTRGFSALSECKRTSIRNFVALSDYKRLPHAILSHCRNAKEFPHAVLAHCRTAKGLHTQFCRVVRIQKGFHTQFRHVVGLQKPSSRSFGALLGGKRHSHAISARCRTAKADFHAKGGLYMVFAGQERAVLREITRRCV